MINACLGFPRIGFQSLAFLGSTVLVERPEENLLITQQSYRTSLRSYINSPRRGADILLEDQVDKFMKTADSFSKLSLYLPSFLGTSLGLISSERERKRALNRVARLRFAFGYRKTRIHLLVIDPVTYFLQAVGVDHDFSNPKLKPLSWAEFVIELRIIHPDLDLFVWKWDYSPRCAEPFLCELLGQPMRYKAGISFIDSSYYFEPPTDRPIGESINESALKEKYSGLYERDLEAIDKMLGVRVIAFD